MAQLNFQIPDGLLDRLDAQKPEYLDRKGFLCLLIDQALDKPLMLTERATATPPTGGGAIASEVSTSNSSSISSSINKSLCDELKKHDELIREFWKVKKGSKGETAWKLLNTELRNLRQRYGDAVVEEQLQLAINGKWAGVRLSNYEQYKPKDAPAPKQRKLTPEEKQAQDERDHQERLRQMGLI